MKYISLRSLLKSVTYTCQTKGKTILTFLIKERLPKKFINTVIQLAILPASDCFGELPL